MSEFFNRDTVSVFPSTYRKYIPNGKFTSEQNFVNILNSVVDNINEGSYVLDYSDQVLKVVIHGYYFEISDNVIFEYVPEEGYKLIKNLWLGIKIQQGGYRLVNFDTLGTENIDTDTKFCGIMYSTNEPNINDSDVYKNYFLNVTDNSGKIINRARFKTDSIYYDQNHDLTSELNTKQYLIHAGNGIETITNNQPVYNQSGEITNKNIVKLQDNEYAKLQSLSNSGRGVGNNLTPVYFDKDGKAVASDYDKLGSNDATKSQSIYIVNGSFVAGQTIYASTGNPTGGKVGDLWLKYSNN